MAVVHRECWQGSDSRDFFKPLIPQRGIFKFSKNVFEFKVGWLLVYFLVTSELLEHCTEPWAWLQTYSLSVCSTFISPLSLHGFQKMGRRRQSRFCVIICWDCFLEWVVTREFRAVPSPSISMVVSAWVLKPHDKMPQFCSGDPSHSHTGCCLGAMVISGFLF